MVSENTTGRTKNQDATYVNMKNFFEGHQINAKEVIRRLKFAVNLESDTDMSDLLGFKNRGQVNMYKIRNRITTEGFTRIVMLLSRPEYSHISLDKLFESTVSPIRDLNSKE